MSTTTSAVVAALDAVAAGLARRLRDAALAERQLERFAFTDEDGGRARDHLAALVRDHGALSALARDITLRALVAAVDGYAMLEMLGAEPVAVESVARGLGMPALAVTERAGMLAQLGLATRDLERGTLGGTPASGGVVALVDVLSTAVAARCRDHLAELA